MSPKEEIPTQICLGKRWNEQDDETCATEDITYTCNSKYQPSKARDNIVLELEKEGCRWKDDSQELSTTFRHAARNLSEFRKMHVDFAKTSSILRPLHNATIPKEVIFTNDMSDVVPFSTFRSTPKKSSFFAFNSTQVVNNGQSVKAINKCIDRIALDSNGITTDDDIDNEELSCEDHSQSQKRANVIAMIRRDFLARKGR